MKKYLFLFFLLPQIAKSQNVGVNTSTPQEKLQLNGSFLITPSHPDNDTIKNSTLALTNNTNYILIYNASKAALRFGYPNANIEHWSNSNTGYASLAFGGGAQASGYGSLAYGYNNTASGGNATALGGNMNLASGYAAVAGGDNSIASGQTSMAFGESIVVRRTSGTGFGMYNDTTQLASTLFSIGNGTAINVRKNALSIMDNGNVGIGISDPDFPLTFTQTLGDKISLLSNGAKSYGLGTANNLLQIHTDTSTADIAFGYGSSAAFTEHMRIKGNGNTGINTASPVYALEVVDQAALGSIAHFRSSNPSSSFINIQNTASGTNTANIGIAMYRSNLAKGYTYVDNTNNYIMSNAGNGTGFICITPSANIGIGTTTPGAKLQVQQKGLYSRSEGQGNALELWDSSGTGDGILYMGADNTNGYGYLQAVATGLFRDLLLQGRGGSVIIGKDQGTSLQVKGDVVTDYSGANTGTMGNSLRFGGIGSGEGIASKRNTGGNVFGLDFYTNGTRRMGVSNGGDIDVVNNLTVAGGKGLVHNNNGVQTKRIVTTIGVNVTVPATDTVGFASRFSFPETFSSPPVVYITGINSVSAGPANVPLQWTFYDIQPGSCRVTLTNPTKYPITVSAFWNMVIEGPQ